jgi:hypothetical protein
MQKHRLTMQQVINTINGVAMVENLDTLDSKTSFWLSRTKDKLVPISKPYEKEREKLQKSSQAEAKGKTDEEIIAIDEKFRDAIQELLNQPSEEMEFYEFKREMFEAKEDLTLPVKAMTEKGEALSHKTIKKGQSLVPIKFFSLMGDLISE